jgi:pyrroloquinoline-quinone synthase
MMGGLGFEPGRFEAIDLVPEAAAYRAFIDQVTTRRPWIKGAALVTIFIEGSREDRLRVKDDSPGEKGSGSSAALEKDLRSHFLVRHYGVDPRFLDLKRAHHQVESGHRRMAWKMVLDHARGGTSAERLQRLLQRSLDLWLLYRDGVARACGLATAQISIHKTIKNR